jgi:hypothetical protein
MNYMMKSNCKTELQHNYKIMVIAQTNLSSIQFREQNKYHHCNNQIFTLITEVQYCSKKNLCMCMLSVFLLVSSQYHRVVHNIVQRLKSIEFSSLSIHNRYNISSYSYNTHSYHALSTTG